MPPDPKTYAQKLNTIRTEAAPTLAKIESGDFEWRDVAQVMEYLQRFGDVMDEMIDNPPAVMPPISDAAVEKIVETLYE